MEYNRTELLNQKWDIIPLARTSSRSLFSKVLHNMEKQPPVHAAQLLHIPSSVGGLTGDEFPNSVENMFQNITWIDKSRRNELIKELVQQLGTNRTLLELYGNDATEGDVSTNILQLMEMPVYQEVLWIVAFAVMIILAILGNCIVIHVVCANQRMRTTTNYFLVNLAIADLMMTILNCSFGFLYMLKMHWVFGAAYCTLSTFVAHLTLAASVFTLAVISFERLLNVLRPLKPRMSKSVCLSLLVGIWVASAAVASPMLLYATTYERSFQTLCVIRWPDGMGKNSKMDYAYTVVIMAVTYVVPMSAMVICYALLGCKLCDVEKSLTQTTRTADYLAHKHKVVKMLALLVSVFAVCWLPYHLYFILVHLYPSVAYSAYSQSIYLACYWLAMSNAMINPIVYNLLNARFRYFFRKTLAPLRKSWSDCVKIDKGQASSSDSDDYDPISYPLVAVADNNRRVAGRSPANLSPKYPLNGTPGSGVTHLIVTTPRPPGRGVPQLLPPDLHS